ncbi:hypothetical protein [Citrobacter sp. Igbk 17]|nr:hypothetical protein [Citrobacter sp. Igbk 17]MDA8497789.1 hypothetical protein [Citrobacter sp. Igbk 17]
MALALSASVQAGENVTVGGYAHTKTAGKSLSGFNAKYGYTPDESDLGVISSLTISADNENDIDRGYNTDH